MVRRWRLLSAQRKTFAGFRPIEISQTEPDADSLRQAGHGHLTRILRDPVQPRRRRRNDQNLPTPAKSDWEIWIARAAVSAYLADSYAANVCPWAFMWIWRRTTGRSLSVALLSPLRFE